MSRTKGILPISANFEPRAAEPFDARCRVETYVNLTETSVWDSGDGNAYTYTGMLVVVYADSDNSKNGLYRLIDTDYTDSNNWELVDSSFDSTLSGLTDVTLNSINEGQILIYSGGTWINKTISLNDIGNISATTATDGQILVYSAGTWFASDVVTNLSGLTDVLLSSPSDGESLIYSAGTWINQYVSGGTGDMSNYWTSGETQYEINFAVSGVNSLWKLIDVDNNITTATDGQILTWNSGTSKWILSDNADFSPYYTSAQTNELFYNTGQTNELFSNTGHSHYLSGLTDVASGATDGEILIFSAGTWVPTSSVISGSYVNQSGDTMTGNLSFDFMTGVTGITENRNLYVDTGGTVREGSNIVSLYFTDISLINFITSGDTGWSGSTFIDTGLTAYTLLEGQKYIDENYVYEYFDGTLYRTYYASASHNHNDIYYTQEQLLPTGGGAAVLDGRYLRTSASTYLSDLGDVNIIEENLSGTSYLKWNDSTNRWVQDDIDFSIYALSSTTVPITRTVTAGSMLTGGGTLNTNITINHDSITTSSISVPSTPNVVTSLTSDGYGHITSYNYTNISSLVPSILNDLNDVSINSLSNGQFLRYNNSTGYFSNVTLSMSMISDFDDSYYVKTATTQLITGEKTFSDNMIVGGTLSTSNVYISGDLFVSGTTTSISTDELKVKDKIITINSGQTSGYGVIGRYAGFEIIRGFYPNYTILFDESLSPTSDASSGTLRIGTTGNTQAVATRQDNSVIVDGGVAYWNDSVKRFDTTNDFVWSANTLTLNGSISGLTSIDGDLNVVGDLVVTGNTYLYGVTTIYSATTISSGDTYIYGILDVNGETTLNNNFYVSGVSNLSDDLYVSGNTYLYDTSYIYNSLYLSGSSYIYDTLDVYGETNFYDNLYVSGGTFSLTYGVDVNSIQSITGITNSATTLLTEQAIVTLINALDYYTQDEVNNYFLSATTTVNDLGGYSTTEVDNNFLSANTSFYTQTEVNNYFLSATTTVNDLGGYSTTEVDNNFLSASTSLVDLGGDTRYVNISGDTMTGDLYVPNLYIGGIEADTVTESAVTATINIGSINIGDIVTSGTSLIEFITALIAPYVSPSFTSFSITTTTLGNIYEVGESVTALTASWVVDNDSNGNPPSNITIDGAGFSATTIVSGGSATSDEPLTSVLVKTGDTTETWTINGYDAESNLITRTHNKYWYFRFFFGANSTELTTGSTSGETQTVIDALQQSWLDSDNSRTVVTTSDNNNASNYTYIAYAAKYGDLSDILSDGALDVIGSFGDGTDDGVPLGDFDYTNSYGHTETYRVYKTNAKGAFSAGINLEIS